MSSCETCCCLTLPQKLCLGNVFMWNVLLFVCKKRYVQAVSSFKMCSPLFARNNNYVRAMSSCEMCCLSKTLCPSNVFLWNELLFDCLPQKNLCPGNIFMWKYTVGCLFTKSTMSWQYLHVEMYCWLSVYQKHNVVAVSSCGNVLLVVCLPKTLCPGNIFMW